VVIDTCGYLPRIVRASAQVLTGCAKYYIFISSISVYADTPPPNIDEDAPLATIEDETVEEITGETYGPLKALCEQEVQSAYPDGALVIRPGLIVGPHDTSDRFTYWPARLARGGDVLAPGDPLMPVQIIDARDLAGWIIKLVEDQVTGVFNATGPEEPMSMQQVIDTCQQVADIPSQITWVDEEFLLGQEVIPYTELPLWVPKPYWWMSQVNISRAMAAGLKFRPFAKTVADTLAWDQIRPPDREWINGLNSEREAELLAAWRGR
jgi:2'-hydroxyisoflavone reductase